ncbi:MAG: tetratricopeptide repeat protein [Anaerolineales bacterium]|nr:tetratricopeptide repeat protein [Anaerolineales bacterium]
MHRAHLFQLLEAAFAAGLATYSRRLLNKYLADWPGDLGAQYMLARAQLLENDWEGALATLTALVATDPEDFRAQRLLATLTREPTAFACAHVGDGLGAPDGVKLPDWATNARAAFLAEKIGDYETAQRESQRALDAAAPDLPLPALIHLTALWHAGRLEEALPLAEGFAASWPEVVAFKLCLAECLFHINAHARAIQLLHDAAAHDIAGQVAARHWGDAHAYRSLWQAEPTFTLPGPLPAELIRLLGLNRLPGKVAPPSSARSAPTSEDVAEIQATLDALAEQLAIPASAGGPGRETFVLLSSRTRLGTVYGAEGFAQVDAAIRELAQAQTVMRPLVVYVDDATILQPLGLQPVDALNAWDIKLLITQLHEKLRAAGDSLGALLIIGGPDIIPFHHLPNPTEDSDADIPSDNPYATSDENYFVPEWPVGRLPSGAGRDPLPLLRILKKAAENHVRARKTGGSQRLWLAHIIARFIAFLQRRRREVKQQPSFGYSANIWKRAAAAVYDVIGNRDDLLTSPPVDVNSLPPEGLVPAHLSYFNLHGVEDGPEWYGQRAPGDPAGLPEYPVALRPGDVVNSGRAPVVVFSEACYGANIFGKTVNDALALRFLDAGTRVLVGSTKIAYGSISEPLIAADLLGRCFWQNINAGMMAGEALRLAKLQLAQEMHNRQGFLDGEDQKTLISFVLYGDPLAVPVPQGPSAAKEAKRRMLRATGAPNRFRPQAARTTPLESALTPESVAHLKALVARYVPGLEGAELFAARARTVPVNGQAKSTSSGATVVTFAKTIQAKARKHSHFARVTFDEKGTITKVAVSR